jgi:glycosyltransferase involved in cell wall biosynthesis
VTSTLLTHLDRERIDPSLCLLRGPISYHLPDDVAVTNLEKERSFQFPRTVFRLRRLLERRRPDVVLSTIAFVNLVTGLALVGLRLPVRWIARVGSTPATEPRWVQTLLGLLYPRADVIAANSEGLGCEFERWKSGAGHSLVVVPNPTDFEAIEQRAGDDLALPAIGAPLVISVGRLIPSKRLEVLLEAFAAVRRKMAVELWLCGDGPARARLERDIARLGLTDSVRVLGHMDNPFPAVRHAAVFAQSSEREGSPNALLEAQGLGVPAVAARCRCGVDEIIEDGETGLLVPVGDAAAMADGLIALLEDDERRARMGRAAAIRARSRYGVAVAIPRYEELLLGK